MKKMIGYIDHADFTEEELIAMIQATGATEVVFTIPDEEQIAKAALNPRRAELIRRLKRRRGYAPPVRGGTGKQRRTRRPTF